MLNPGLWIFPINKQRKKLKKEAILERKQQQAQYSALRERNRLISESVQEKEREIKFKAMKDEILKRNHFRELKKQKKEEIYKKKIYDLIVDEEIQQ